VNIKVAAVLNYLGAWYGPGDRSDLLNITSIDYDSLVKDCRHSHASQKRASVKVHYNSD
jgi:hypothetical protein